MKTVLTIATLSVLATIGINAMACGADDDGSKSGSTTEISAASDSKAPKSFDKAPKAGTRAYCPVMKAEFTVTEQTQRSEYQGKHYVFCCPGCKTQFDANPKKYI